MKHCKSGTKRIFLLTCPLYIPSSSIKLHHATLYISLYVWGKYSLHSTIFIWLVSLLDEDFSLIQGNSLLFISTWLLSHLLISNNNNTWGRVIRPTEHEQQAIVLNSVLFVPKVWLNPSFESLKPEYFNCLLWWNILWCCPKMLTLLWGVHCSKCSVN